MLHKYATDPDPATPEEVDFFKHRQKSPAVDPALINKIKKSKLGKIGEIVVYQVDDERIRNYVDLDFVMAGNFARDSYIPVGEIWISQLLKPSDYGPALVHEYVEAILMSEHDIEYGDAHDYANVFESRMRRKIVSKDIKIKDNKDAFKQANKMVAQFLSDAITRL